MFQPKRFNIVTFNPMGPDPDYPDGSHHVFLKLEGEFIQRAGLEPDINRAIIPYTEFEKLFPPTADKATRFDLSQPGKVEFWFTDEPENLDDLDTVPDHSIPGIRIVDVEPVEWGIVKGEDKPRVVEYRLYLSDMRERFVPPRGGILTDGPLNDEKLKPDDPKLVLNSLLIEKCREAMRVLPSDPAVNPIPNDVDIVPPIRGLQWNGTSATEELAKLLVQTFSVALPDYDVVNNIGQLRIEMIGQGEEPTVPADRAVPVVRLPGKGRRGKVLILTSAPYPVTDTVSLMGPSPDTWEFVAQDSDDVYRPLEQVSLYGFESTANHVKQDFAGIRAEFRQRIKGDTYHYIQLSAKYKNPAIGHVLRVAQVGDEVAEPQVSARIAVPAGGGNFINSSGYVRCNAAFMKDNPLTAQSLIYVSQLLGRMDVDDAASFTQHFQELSTSDMSVRFSFLATEQAVKDDPASERLKYTMFAFIQEGGRVERLGEEEIKQVLDPKNPANGDVVFVASKQLRLYRVDGQYTNLKQVEDQAKAMAKQYLAGSDQEYKVMMASGFLSVKLSGKVSEIRWDQAGCKTIWKVNSWGYPLTSTAVRQMLLRGGGEAFGGQSSTEAARTSMGTMGAHQPIVPISPQAADTGGGAVDVIHCVVTPYSGLAWDAILESATFTYNCTTESGTLLAANIAPAVPRPPFRMKAGGPWGIGFYDKDRNFVLFDCGETIDKDLCATS